jgi:hypothetical protein
MAIEIQAPNDIPNVKTNTKIFLGGSIEMGKAIDWQKDLIERLKDEMITFLNPRRSDWDSSWTQEITNPKFKEQVDWELNGLDIADIIVMVFDPNTMSPISLLELGLHASSEKMVVICPEGFWRKGNVDIVCEKHNIKQVNDIDELVKYIYEKI